ncbi:MAG: hypothetical protein J0I27_23415 [Pandoraea pnomenusa]|nr:hypothetical protein [Pandoraea pnomenusa]MBN9096213.1 hypothetical protein [Pandoraea pnomenusa]
MHEFEKWRMHFVHFRHMAVHQRRHPRLQRHNVRIVRCQRAKRWRVRPHPQPGKYRCGTQVDRPEATGLRVEMHVGAVKIAMRHAHLHQLRLHGVERLQDPSLRLAVLRWPDLVHGLARHPAHSQTEVIVAREKCLGTARAVEPVEHFRLMLDGRPDEIDAIDAINAARARAVKNLDDELGIAKILEYRSAVAATDWPALARCPQKIVARAGVANHRGTLTARMRRDWRKGLGRYRGWRYDANFGGRRHERRRWHG